MRKEDTEWSRVTPLTTGCYVLRRQARQHDNLNPAPGCRDGGVGQLEIFAGNQLAALTLAVLKERHVEPLSYTVGNTRVWLLLFGRERYQHRRQRLRIVDDHHRRILITCRDKQTEADK